MHYFTLGEKNWIVTLREKLDHYISLQYRVLKSYNIWRGRESQVYTIQR